MVNVIVPEFKFWLDHLLTCVILANSQDSQYLRALNLECKKLCFSIRCWNIALYSDIDMKCSEENGHYHPLAFLAEGI